MPTPIRSTREGPIAVVTLDDGKANVIAEPWLDAFAAALDAAASDDTVGAVLIEGRPGMLSAGLDLRTLPTLSRAELVRVLNRFRDAMVRLVGFPKPVVVAATGHALAGGAILLLAGDHRLAVRGRFKVGLTEVSVGLPLPTFAVALGRERLPPASHVPALVAGRAFDPEGALAHGLVDELVDPEALRSTALERARALAAIDTHAFGVTKRRLRASVLATADVDLGDELSGVVNLPAR